MLQVFLFCMSHYQVSNDAASLSIYCMFSYLCNTNLLSMMLKRLTNHTSMLKGLTDHAPMLKGFTDYAPMLKGLTNYAPMLKGLTDHAPMLKGPDQSCLNAVWVRRELWPLQTL